MKVAAYAALSMLLLASCGSGDQTPVRNEAAGTEAEAIGNAVSSAPARPDTANEIAEPAPPDAVSHPNGYLPPAPGEANPTAANSSGPTAPPPATEDEYMRNRQSGG